RADDLRSPDKPVRDGDLGGGATGDVACDRYNRGDRSVPENTSQQRARSHLLFHSAKCSRTVCARRSDRAPAVREREVSAREHHLGLADPDRIDGGAPRIDNGPPLLVNVLRDARHPYAAALRGY